MKNKAYNSTDDINRRDFVQRAAMTAAAFAVTPPLSLLAASSKADVLAQIPSQADNALRDAYAALKSDLAARFPRDREAYIEAKGAFVNDILRPGDRRSAAT